MNVNSKREFTPYSFGIAYAEANPSSPELWPITEIASTYYTPKSRSWQLFIEGMEKTINLKKLKDAKQ